MEDRRLLVKISHMYYLEGATQSEIAKVFGVSRSLISKYLSKAREAGIVEIKIHDGSHHPFMNIEARIEKKYGLREVICVPNLGNGTDLDSIGTYASRYLLRILKNGQIVGVSSGTTLLSVAKQLSAKLPYASTTFVPIVGGMGDERVDIHANVLVSMFAEKLKAHYKFLHAPVIADSKKDKELFMSQSSIQSVFELAEKADIILVGIGGSPKHSTITRSEIGKKYRQYFNELDAVGDICYKFIDENGNAPSNSWNDKIISFDIKKLKKIPFVIGVAAGVEKVEAIKAVLNGKLINVLITDEKTAEMLGS
ncbi:bacterial regulatory, arsR family protein [Anoxybacillus sp. B7M1]|uniref:Sugar-binding transcriptional regulator n=1 Tax=Anoxybacteroides rupiense TaxID=311460 RepID=A0ABT5W6D7_9BACL|nr:MULTISPECIES: sugar-binding transcriptional regulator [Anoxybacillus]ANB57592.1 bacterial regulatory, arsR family protein [Anoxybacillus sp. B2M1]ANB63152.1 bacterial regulatory, arsR family protein [Anoxybacillus sp. B7M1]MBB3908763.1 DNA-binding transcriptional regulator LsrR (DeoR family) [Anoxybacillus rupiensis]MDE8564902.1 sugar-binding transcriptional regulator [Anoxybacillus rupiensis]